MVYLMRAMILIALYVISPTVFAEGTIVQGMTNTVYMIRAAIAVVIAGAALGGLWFVVTGISGMVNGNPQQSASQSFARVLGGLVLMSVMAFSSALITEFGIEGNTNSAIAAGFGG